MHTKQISLPGNLCLTVGPWRRKGGRWLWIPPANNTDLWVDILMAFTLWTLRDQQPGSSQNYHWLTQKKLESCECGWMAYWWQPTAIMARQTQQALPRLIVDLLHCGHSSKAQEYSWGEAVLTSISHLLPPQQDSKAPSSWEADSRDNSPPMESKEPQVPD